jgi:hypothetical protein
MILDDALLRPVTKMKCSMPAARASSTTYWISGRSTTVSISFGIALVAGRKRVPRPATGKTALRIGAGMASSIAQNSLIEAHARQHAVNTLPAYGYAEPESSGVRSPA